MENEVKEPAPRLNRISQEEYLEMERAADTKHEYFQGEIYAMSGASPQHNDISFNINRLVAPFLFGKGCKLYGSDFRLHIPANTLYTYPDFTIVCGPAETSGNYADNLLNPTILIEILSKSTRDYDRGNKFSLYREIATLKEYIMVDSTAISVEHFIRQDEHSWQLTEFKQLTDTFTIHTIGMTLALSDLYFDVQLPE